MDTTIRRGHRGTILAVLLVILAASVPYISTLQDYFLADDFGVVQLLASKPASYFPKWFVSTWMDDIWGFTLDEIRPFPAVSYQFTALWGAASPVANHVVNIGLHILNALMVFAISRRIAGLGLLASTLSAMLFAVLPIQAETVVWITGRVDSIPTFFYLASFLAFAIWRRSGAAVHFWVSVAMCFFALFSKQTAITMVATLVLYDILIERVPVTVSGWVRSYGPFVVLTAGYLWLRYYLFNQAIREGALNFQTLVNFGTLQARHLQKLMLGSVMVARDPVSPAFRNVAFVTIAIVLLLVSLLVLYRMYVQKRETASRGAADTGALLLFFGPIWWLIGTAPTAAANYESARHLYLGSVGFAIAVAIVLDRLWRGRNAWVKYAAIFVGLTLMFVYTSSLHVAVSEWSKAAFLSQSVTSDVNRLAAQSPMGTLLIIDPAESPSPSANSPYPENFWAWAIPFALQPPFAPSDLTKRVFVISPAHIHCCDIQWFDYTRNNLIAWAKQQDRPPLIWLRWNPTTGELLQFSDKEMPQLRDQLMKLSEAATREQLTEKFYALIHELRAA